MNDIVLRDLKNINNIFIQIIPMLLLMISIGVL